MFAKLNIITKVEMKSYLKTVLESVCLTLVMGIPAILV
jgi:hypothetical protein